MKAKINKNIRSAFLKSRTPFFVRCLSLVLILAFTSAEQLHAQLLYRFVIIGDYGLAGTNEQNVSVLIQGWSPVYPAFIITTGDNNYPSGASSTIDLNIGQYYHGFIFPYTGGFGQGDTVNRFFPSLGNHDWLTAGAQPYLNYFALPGNERYYTFTKPPVQFFSIDSDPSEPDGVTSASVQGQWLQSALASSTARFKIVYFHHPPYSSGTTHGNTAYMQWPFRQWGASIVLSGHEHNYERLFVNNFTYIVNGLGGASIYPFGTPVPGSIVRYNGNYGAQLVSVYNDSINFKFHSVTAALIDSYTLMYTPIGITNNNNEIPEQYSLSQNYPNPFNPMTKIRFDIPLSRGVDAEGRRGVLLVIYDILGREITALVNEQLKPGTYEVDWDASNYPSGVYYYKLSSGDPSVDGQVFIETKKMILIK